MFIIGFLCGIVFLFVVLVAVTVLFISHYRDPMVKAVTYEEDDYDDEEP